MASSPHDAWIANAVWTTEENLWRREVMFHWLPQGFHTDLQRVNYLAQVLPMDTIAEYQEHGWLPMRLTPWGRVLLEHGLFFLVEGSDRW
eukprot:2649959-Karenia_brevis.AAC.1